MVCTQCGAYTDQNIKYCAVCGAPLPKTQSSPAQASPETQAPVHSTPAPPVQQSRSEEEPSWGFVRAPKWPTPSFDLNAIDETALKQQAPSTPPAQPGAYVPPASSRQFEPRPAAAPVEPQASTASRASVGDYEYSKRAPQGSFGRAPQREADSFNLDEGDDEYDFYDDDEDDIDIDEGMSFSKPSRRKSSGGRQTRSRSSSLNKKRASNSTWLFVGITALLVVLLVVFGGIYINRNFGSLSGLFTTLFGGSPLLAEPEVTEGLDSNGVDCYVIKVETREGNVVTMRVAGIQLSEEVDSRKFKTLYFPKHLFLPDEPVEAATAQMVPDIIITTPKGEEYQVEIPPITVNIPAINLSVTSPESEQVTVSRNIVNFTGTVDQPDADVRIEGLALEVDESGNFAGAFELPGFGTHTVTLTAQKNGYQIAKKSITLEYVQSVANLSIDRGTIRANESGLATIKGTIDAGATMAVSGPDGVVLGTPTVDASGSFSFTAQMEKTGFYEITCAVTKDGSTITDTVITEFAPDYTTYTAAVHKLAYSRMINETKHTGSYKCIGTVTEIYNSGNYDLAKLVTSDGEEMIFEYRNNVAEVALNDGKTYNLYADYVGIDPEYNLPRVYAWYITKK
ncbi:hypothetical protein LJC07_02315 [Christensenellaceae bacterium OttesenSCG-928-L17]|nr:hypothetical protein [Christensenellaceae bacterium OttesenSCG-928-L17]